MLIFGPLRLAPRCAVARSLSLSLRLRNSRSSATLTTLTGRRTVRHVRRAPPPHAARLCPPAAALTTVFFFSLCLSRSGRRCAPHSGPAILQSRRRRLENQGEASSVIALARCVCACVCACELACEFRQLNGLLLRRASQNGNVRQENNQGKVCVLTCFVLAASSERRSTRSC